MSGRRRRRGPGPRQPRYPGGWLAPSVRDTESRLWPVRLLGGVAAVAVLFLPHSAVAPYPLLIVGGAWAAGYGTLRLSRLSSPYFGVGLVALDLVTITLAVEFSGGTQSVLALGYLYPVAVTAMIWGLWPGLVAAAAALGVHVASLGPQALWREAPRDTVVLVAALAVAVLAAGAIRREGQRVIAALVRRLALLHERLGNLPSQGSVTELLQQSVDLAQELTGARYAAAVVWDGQGQVSHFLTAGMDPATAPGVGHPPVGAGLLGIVRDAPRPIRLADAREHPAAVAELPAGHPPMGSFLGVPIPALGEWRGAFYMLQKGDHGGFTFDDEHIAEMMASQVGAAVVMRRLAASQREMYDSLLEMLVSISDTREHAIRGHSGRVSRWARALAELRGLSEEEVNHIAVAGLLHDIGKIGVPDSILGKPGKLSDEERLLMMAHAALGAAIVEHAGPLATIAPMVRHHHERWDGGGYPEGLRAEAIPLGARIVTLADTLDSMTTDRPYRAATTIEEALREIARCAGSQFDPSLAALVGELVGKASPPPAAEPAAAEGPATLAELHSTVQMAGWKLFTRLSRDLRVVLDMPLLAERILTAIVEEMPVAGASLALLEDGGRVLRVVAQRGSPALLPRGRALTQGEGLVWAALERGATLAVPEVEADPRYRGRQGEGRHSGMFVPLVASAGMQGVLSVHRPWPQTFGEQTVRQLEAAALVAAETLAVSRLHGQLQEAALRDLLTGVGSRRHGLDRLAAACAEAERHHRPFVMILLDLDGFKAVNDRFGHQVGDAVLRHVSATLQQRARPHDVVARHGGDEFLVIPAGVGRDEVAPLVRRLVTRAAPRTMVVDGHKVEVPSWSAGFAVWGDDGQDADELLRVAEERLHTSKAGRAARGG